MTSERTASSVCSLSPFLRGEGWGEGQSQATEGLPLTPSLSAEVGYIRLRPAIRVTKLGYTRVWLPQERGEGAGRVAARLCVSPPRNYANERGRGARSHPRSAGRVDHRLSHRRRDDHHLRGGGASLRREQFRGACHMGRRPWPRLGPGRRGGGLPLAHLDQSVLGAGARHLHVRVDGQVRRRARRAHRHPCGRRRLRQAAYPRDPQAGDRVRAVVRGAVHRRDRHPGRDLRLRPRCRPGLAGARMAELDDLSVHPARFLSHVLPLSAGDVALSADRLRPASCARAGLRASA